MNDPLSRLWRCCTLPGAIKIATLFFSLPISQNPVLAQGYIGIRITPNFTSEPKVLNNSPASISTGTTTAIEAGLDYTHMLNRKWGVSAGTDFGGGNWSYNLKAPLSAFQPGQAGEVNLSRFHNYLYNSATLNAVYKVSALGNVIRIFAGPTFRVNHSQRVGTTRKRNNPDNLMYADAPAAGSETPDFAVEYPNDARIFTIMSAGVGYEHSVNNNLDVLLGVRTNWGITSVTKGTMTINMNDKLYRGSINTRSNYVGFDVALRFKTFSTSNKGKF
ncbi:hypothetical protein [Daejeonella lutea]|uniref:Outer membrane protein beta-barrel domain-containing protein n=1 Tax=Daejeonella lutea TaxID=572036 RepID=A0A1T5DPL1_9SPHI|nr:hypothetical protein [Daejeonella lutea]SKB73551.1 hypothetical protein SAMN05661099_2495 [Daejeonella lutea]